MKDDWTKGEEKRQDKASEQICCIVIRTPQCGWAGWLASWLLAGDSARAPLLWPPARCRAFAFGLCVYLAYTRAGSRTLLVAPISRLLRSSLTRAMQCTQRKVQYCTAMEAMAMAMMMRQFD